MIEGQKQESRAGRDDRSGRGFSRTLLITAAVLFALEFVVMRTLHVLGLPVGVWQDLVDSLILAALALPALYAVGFRPRGRLCVENVRGYTRSEKYTLCALSVYVATVVLIGCLQGGIATGQESSSRVINVAGRQRMLAQYVAREALHWRVEHLGDPQGGREHLEIIDSKAALFERSLAALLDGDAERGMPPCTDPAVREQLLAAGTAWVALRAALPPVSDLSDLDRIAALDRASEDTLAKMDGAVTLLQEHYEDRAERLLAIQTASVGAAGLIGLLLIAFSFQAIRQRRELQAGLMESDERFRQLAANVEQVFWIASRDYQRIIYVSPAYERIWSRSCKSLYERPRSWVDAIHPEDRERVLAALEGDPQNRFDQEYRIVRPDGSLCWIWHRGLPVRDNSGKIYRIAGVAEDITERKRMNESLRQSEAQVTLLLNSTAEAIYGLDLAGNCTFCNLACLRMLGYSDDADVLGMNMHDLIHHTRPNGASYPVHECRIYQAFREGKGTHVDDEVLWRADGSSFSAEYWSYPIRQNGEVVGSVVTFLDITERKRAKELQIAKEAAETSTRTKSEFLANMSHEIRTPMTAILGYTDELIDENRASASTLESLDIIKRNGNHLLEIINDILDISKIEAGKLKVDRVCCSPTELLAGVKSLMNVRSEARKLSFELEFAAPTPETILTDPTRLRQILVNLVGNAIKFTHRGGVRLVTSLKDADSSEPKMRFRVIDTGIGMTAEQLTGLFQPFQQANGSVTRTYGGTGLGLAISKRLAEMLGGDVTVQSNLGEGSEFCLTIPTGPLDDVAMIDGASRAVEAGVARTNGDDRDTKPVPSPQLDCHILLAEDCPDNQRLIAHVLEKAGAEVTTVENGREAVERATAAMKGRREDDPPGSFDIILMDMQMPIMDGYEATRELRRAGFTCPIIALTAHAMSGDRQKCIRAGCSDYATKPISNRKLIETIVQHLQTESVTT